MATKKEKRARGLAKHEAFMKQYRRDGLKAQAADRERRAQEREKAVKEIEKSSLDSSALDAPGHYLSREAVLSRLIGIDNLSLTVDSDH